ncbi:MAG TPA: hypothetical protein VM077_03035 [Candidatus Limnocylindrales bacterium]|nr:hypothetical protein [Candidatus Limnocylindrales bacterium]
MRKETRLRSVDTDRTYVREHTVYKPKPMPNQFLRRQVVAGVSALTLAGLAGGGLIALFGRDEVKCDPVGQGEKTPADANNVVSIKRSLSNNGIDPNTRTPDQLIDDVNCATDKNPSLRRGTRNVDGQPVTQYTVYVSSKR